MDLTVVPKFRRGVEIQNRATIGYQVSGYSRYIIVPSQIGPVLDLLDGRRSLGAIVKEASQTLIRTERDAEMLISFLSSFISSPFIHLKPAESIKRSNRRS